jgi:hypothetical protein
MEREEAARLILDGFENGYLSIEWKKGKVKSYSNLIREGEKLGFLEEVCAGCGKSTSGRDCGCPAGTRLRWSSKIDIKRR